MFDVRAFLAAGVMFAFLMLGTAKTDVACLTLFVYFWLQVCPVLLGYEKLEFCQEISICSEVMPAGWEVCDGNLKRQLQDVLHGWPTLQSPDHDYGFLHRVDEIHRDYVVLCHGWLHDRTIEAHIDMRGHGPTWTGRIGKPSRSFIKLVAQVSGFAAASLTLVRIATGRRYQIRSHAAFIAHPVVRDEKFTAAWLKGDSTWKLNHLSLSKEAFGTQECDFKFCERCFLHRYSLLFKDRHGELHEVTDSLPTDLSKPLGTLAARSPRFAASLHGADPSLFSLVRSHAQAYVLVAIVDIPLT
eukprot:s173_g35.t1